MKHRLKKVIHQWLILNGKVYCSLPDLNAHTLPAVVILNLWNFSLIILLRLPTAALFLIIFFLIATTPNLWLELMNQVMNFICPECVGLRAEKDLLNLLDPDVPAHDLWRHGCSEIYPVQCRLIIWESDCAVSAFKLRIVKFPCLDAELQSLERIHQGLLSG